MLKNKTFLFTLFFSFFCVCTYAQSIYKNYTVSNGLLSNNTYGILQDSKGFMWISSDRGLNKYDGTRFVNYDVTDGLVDNQIINIFYDSKGRIWLNSLNGKLSYIFQNKVFTEDNDASLKNNFGNTKAIGSITEDKKGNIHFNIISGNYEFEYDNKKVLRIDLLADFGIKSKQAYFTVTQNNELYRVHSAGVYGANNYEQLFTHRLIKSDQSYVNIAAHNNADKIVYLDSTGVSQIIPSVNSVQLFQYPKEIKSDNVKKIFYTKNNIWLGLYSGGFYRFALENNAWINKGLLFDKVDINNVFEDGEGNFWVTTNYSGIYYLPTFYEDITSLNKINDNKLSKCFSIKFFNNEMWLGAENYAINKIINKKIVQTFNINRTGLGGNKAYKLLVNDQFLYAGFLNGICQVNKVNVNEQKEINSVLNTAKGVVKMPGIPLKSFVFDKAGKMIISGGVRDFFESDDPLLIKKSRPCLAGGRSYFAYTDPLGNSFISTNKGVAKMQDTNYIFLNKTDTVLKEKINTMAFVREGVYIIGNSAGLHLIKNNKTIFSLTDKKILPGVNCKKSVSKFGQIWIMCDIGVIRVVEKNNSLEVVQKFDLRNGLLNEPPLDIETDSTNVYVVIGTDVLAISKKIKNVLPKSKTVITDFIINGLNKNFDNLPTVKETDLPLKISFDLLAYGITENKEFQYRLSQNEVWKTVSTNSISLSDLDNGKLNFEVRGRIGNEEWGETTTYSFTYNKPFYKIRLVQLSALFLSMLALFIWWQRKQKRNQKLVNEKYEMANKIAALKNQAMQNLMHPHFVFNSLNSIQHYINSNDKENANKYLTRFAKLIRLNLNSGINGFITIEDEIERLQLYLNLEALRFENEITFSIKAHKDVDEEELYLPSMILQPFVENALWHGILPSGKRGNISIYFSIDAIENIKITIEDDGIGVENSRKQKTNTSHRSKGLSLIKERLDLLQEKFKKPFSIVVSIPNADNVTQPGNKVIVLIPFLYEDDIK